MKKLIVLGASSLQLPGIIRAKQLGFYIGVVDQDLNSVGKKYADEFFNISTTDADEILKISEEFRPDGIITLATDMPMRAISKVNKKLNLLGISEVTAIKATDKGEMSKTFKKENIDSPLFFLCSTIEELIVKKKEIHYPCIIKPTDSSGSRGVKLVENESDLESAFYYSQKYSKSGNVIVQEYINGIEVSVEIIVENNVPFVLAVTDKLTSGAPYFVELGHSQPSQLSLKKLKEIKTLAMRAVQAIGIENGPAHVEIIINDTSNKIIELGARLGGDYITSHLVPLSTGIDMIENTIKLACSLKTNLKPLFKKGSAIRYITANEGKIASIEGIDEAKKVKGIKEVVLTKQRNDFVKEVKSSSDRIGYIIAQGNSVEEAIESCNIALCKLKINIIEK